MTNTRALLLLDYQVALCEEGPHLRMPPLAAQVAERDVLATAEKVLSAARPPAGWSCTCGSPSTRPTPCAPTASPASTPTPIRGHARRLAGSADRRAARADRGEPVIDKGCVDPFVGTPLRDVLAAEGITEVVLGGVATNLVVESAARHASDAGLQVTVVEDMCASFRADFHEFSVQNMLPLFGTVTTAADLMGELS